MEMLVLIPIVFIAFGVFALVDWIAVDVLGFRAILGLGGVAAAWLWLT